MAAVEGLVKDGAAVVRNIPVLIGGVDGSGNVQTLAVDSSGNLDVVVATGPVTVADGADVAQGSTTDTAVGDANGTVNAHARQIAKLLGSTLTVGSHAVTNAGTFAVQAAGDVASNATDSGNPVKVGARYASSPSSLTNGQRTDLLTTSKGSLAVTLRGDDNTTNVDTARLSSADDAQSGSVYGLVVGARGLGFNGASWDLTRTAKVFKTATATATGDTAVWTPTSGKKFRLLRYAIYLTGNATLAAGAALEILLRDSTTATGVGMSVFVPTLAITDQFGFASGWITLDNGILSATANNVLNVNLSAALATGEIRVVAIGTEE